MIHRHLYKEYELQFFYSDLFHPPQRHLSLILNYNGSAPHFDLSIGKYSFLYYLQLIPQNDREYIVQYAERFVEKFKQLGAFV